MPQLVANLWIHKSPRLNWHGKYPVQKYFGWTDAYKQQQSWNHHPSMICERIVQLLSHVFSSFMCLWTKIWFWFYSVQFNWESIKLQKCICQNKSRRGQPKMKVIKIVKSLPKRLSSDFANNLAMHGSVSCQWQNFKHNKFCQNASKKEKYGNIPTSVVHIFSNLHEITSPRLALMFFTEAYQITQYLHFLIGCGYFQIGSLQGLKCLICQ